MPNLSKETARIPDATYSVGIGTQTAKRQGV